MASTPCDSSELSFTVCKIRANPKAVKPLYQKDDTLWEGVECSVARSRSISDEMSGWTGTDRLGPTGPN
jgi:hypothetical protein